MPLSVPLKFRYPDEFSVFVRFWPVRSGAVLAPQAVKLRRTLVNDLEDAEWEDEEDIARIQIKIPRGVTREEAKQDVIDKLSSLGYINVLHMRLFDNLKGKLFCIID